MWQHLQKNISGDNRKALARAISLIENEHAGYLDFLRSLPNFKTPLIGLTGPPGAGKSTVTDVLIEQMIQQNKKVGVLCIDPSSPFNYGALLGDRIRMNRWFNNDNVFIRSLASRGNVGGVNPKIIEITSLMQAAAFDYIIIETVGTGQNEIDVAGIADVTVVVLIPDSGDEIQTLKSGLMEIADVFVVNKSDRPEADLFTKNLRSTLAHYKSAVPVVQTVAISKEGIGKLYESIQLNFNQMTYEKHLNLLAGKAFYLIREMRMQNVSKTKLKEEITKSLQQQDFNLYRFIKNNL